MSLSGHVGDGGVLGNLANGKTKVVVCVYLPFIIIDCIVSQVVVGCTLNCFCKINVPLYLTNVSFINS